MLQKGLFVIGLLLSLTGVWLIPEGAAKPGRQLLVTGGILIIALICERWRYRKSDTQKKGKWQLTGERFEDPETGEIVEVLYNPDTGERRYSAVSKPTDPNKP